LEDDLRAAQNRELSKADQKLGVLYLYDRDGLGSMILTLPDRFSGASVQRGFSSNTTAIGPGSFAPLRHVPDDKMVVLGLISTKRPQMEAPEDLIRRITQANRFVPLERLALSTQCGFASSIVGNRLSIDDERRKLERVCETARRVWT
jgi:methionine synthase II (cobalamin-independent)